MLATFCIVVFGLSTLVVMGGISKAHCQVVLAQQARSSYFVGSSLTLLTDLGTAKKEILSRINSELSRWPLIIQAKDLQVVNFSNLEPKFVQFQASFAPFGGAIPGLQFEESVVVLSENG